MALYMWQLSYTADAWAAQLKHPQNRVDLVRPVAERLGGTIIDAWFAFGEYDIFVLLELPDNVNAAALVLAGTASGMVKSGKTTPLMTIDEGLAALRKAGEIAYPAPKG